MMHIRPKPELRNEILRYILVGGLAVAIDAAGYFLLVRFDVLSPPWAKRASFAAGAVWAFAMNKFFTFRQKELRAFEPFAFAIVYLAGWFLNSITHDIVLRLTNLKPASFLAATAVSTCTNYLGQKYAVFKQRPRPS